MLRETLVRSERRRSSSRVRSGSFRSRGPRPAAILGPSEGDEPIDQRGYGGRGRDRKDPGPDDPVGDAPPDRGEAVSGADPHDGAGDGVGGAHRDSQQGRAQEGEGPGGFGAKSSDR